MKKNLILRLGVAVLMMSVITLSLVSGTFAKYTKGYTGVTETVTAADFKFALTDETQVAYTESADFDIFQYTNTAIWGDGAGLVAPGSAGSLEINVENQSQVDIDLTVGLVQVNDGNIPVYYTLTTDGTADPQRYSDALAGVVYDSVTPTSYLPLSALATALGNGAAIPATDGTTLARTEYIINWNWAYEVADDTVYSSSILIADGMTNDEYDTSIGEIVAEQQVILTITVNATQVEG